MTRVEVSTTQTSVGWTCRVSVYATTTTEHEVRVTRADLERLDPGATDPTDLVRRAFEFLLDREPNTSILRAFNLPAISSYFPEFEAEVTGDRQGRSGRRSSSPPR